MRRGGGVDTDRREVSRIGNADPGEDEGLMGFDLSDDLRRRTGPGPGEERESESGMRERSAMSHGFRRSGEASKEEIQGRSSKTCDSTRLRRLREEFFERLRDEDAIHDWDALIRAFQVKKRTRLTAGVGRQGGERWMGDRRRSRGWKRQTGVSTGQMRVGTSSSHSHGPGRQGAGAGSW